MNLRTIGIICAVILVLALSVGLGFKIMQKTEGYKADTQEFYSFEPHFFVGGCASYRVMQAESQKRKVIRKGTVKPKQDVASQKKVEVKK